MSTWYKKCMPTVKEISKDLPNLFKKLKNETCIDTFYIWGSYSNNISKPTFRVKDIDIIAQTDFLSDDFVSVDKNILLSKQSNEELENLGFNPEIIKFSSAFTNITQHNIDHWALSSDQKLIHWGPISADRQESDYINKDAEIYAGKQAGVERHKISKASKEKRINWYENYYDYLHRFYNNMPSGWYSSDIENVNDIISKAIKF